MPILLLFFLIDYLKGKTCILVTHQIQIQYLINVDHIALMENVTITYINKTNPINTIGL